VSWGVNNFKIINTTRIHRKAKKTNFGDIETHTGYQIYAYGQDMQRSLERHCSIYISIPTLGSHA
jgi:hypothetical protein